MESSNIVRDIDSLPPQAQKEILDFVAFLKARYASVSSGRKRLKLEDEPFVGMWESREDMRDSVSWIRELHRREWECGEKAL